MGMQAYSAYVQAKNPTGSVTVAVIDSGVGDAPTLNNHVRSDGADFLSVGDRNPRYDATGHGTDVACLIIDASYGANIQILPVRVFSANKDDTMLSMLINAVDFVKRKHVDVVNMSFKVDYSAVLENKINQLSMPVVVAAGNDGVSTENVFPAKLSSVITVSAIDASLVKWVNSNYGTSVDYCAPGVNVNTDYSSPLNGTSYAAPHISAAIALLELDPNHTISDISDPNSPSIIDLGAKGKDTQYGIGLPYMAMLTDRVQRIDFTDSGSHVIKLGSTVNVQYAVLPTSAANKSVTLTTSNPNVLTAELVSAGIIKLTAKSKGTATLTITSNDNSQIKYTSSEYRVVSPVTKITIDAPKDEINLYSGETLGFYYTIEPTNPAPDNAGINWSSSNTSVATVAQNGVVTPKAVGETTIRADAADGFGAYAEMKIKVVSIAEPTELQIDASVNPIKVGGTSQLTVTVYPEGANTSVIWSPLDSTIATIDRRTGVVTALKSGKARFEAISTVNYDITAQYEITVIKEPESISLGGPDIINVGETAKITATVNPSDADDTTVDWSITAGESYATVDHAGNVNVASAPASGTGTIIVRATSITKPAVYVEKTITIRQMPKNITITGKSEMFVGDIYTFTASVTPNNAYNRTVTWSTSDSSIATVNSNGVVTGVGEGIATIKATSNVDSTLSKTYSVNVYPQWNDWSEWSDTSYTATSSMQVEKRYRYRDKTQEESYGQWSAWSEWSLSADSTSDENVKEVQVATVFPWYCFACASCGYHVPFSNSKCPNCGHTGASWSNWWYTTEPWYISNPTDYNKVSYTETEYGYGLVWSYSTYRAEGVPANGTGYRSRTRTYTPEEWSDWSSWSSSEVSETDTRQVEIQYRYRTKYDPHVTVSGWVKASEAPSGANIVARKWTYTETTTSAASSLSGWTQAGSNWVTTGNGFVDWVDFSVIPGFKRDHSLYSKYNVSAPTGSNEAGTRRTVSTFYWHWMYSTSANAYDRAIYWQEGTPPKDQTNNNYYYKNFGAFESSNTYPVIDGNWAQDDRYYTWYKVSDRTSNADSQGSYYWYRAPINRTSYTDETLYYTYTRAGESSTRPTADNISNIQEYVMYETTR